MTNIIQRAFSGPRSVGTKIGIITAAVVSIGFASQAYAYTLIQSQLDLGETNADVTSLQTFFADNATIYPEGLVTGYFGNLTRTAVVRFQAAYGLDQAGRVGPMTRDRINSLINAGGWNGTVVSSSDVSGPSISTPSLSIGSNAATFTWNTNENATAKVFYYTSPVKMNEGDINSVGFGATNGWVAANDNLARTSQVVNVTGLVPNTTYYYVVVSTDLSGNVSVFGPNNSFRTNSQ